MSKLLKFIFINQKLYFRFLRAAFFWWIALTVPSWSIQNLDLNGFFQKTLTFGVDAGTGFYTETKEFDEAFQYFENSSLGKIFNFSK